MCFKIYKVSKVSFIIFIYIMKLLLITVLSKSVHLWVTWDKIISPFVRFATFLLSGAPREFFSSQTEAMTQKRLANYLNLSSPLVQLWLVPPFLPRHASPRSSPPPHLCAGYVSAPRGLCRHPCVCVCSGHTVRARTLGRQFAPNNNQPLSPPMLFDEWNHLCAP